jgi:hypothetical protein
MEQDGATVDREKQEFGESYEKVQGSMLNAYPRRGSYSLLQMVLQILGLLRKLLH